MVELHKKLKMPIEWKFVNGNFYSGNINIDGVADIRIMFMFSFDKILCFSYNEIESDKPIAAFKLKSWK